jgi:hypothetical protein
MGITEQGRGNSMENLREPNLKSAKICLQMMSILFAAYTDGISDRLINPEPSSPNRV